MAVGQPGEPSRRGHVAIVAPDFEATLARLGEGGFEVSETRNLWGARRARAGPPPATWSS